MTTSVDDRRIADTILGQLPRMWAPMISGKAIYAERGVDIRFKGCRKANIWTITLAGDNTYTVQFCKRSGGRYNTRTGVTSPVKETKLVAFTGIYCNQLRAIFEQHTGLFLSL